MTRLLVAPEGPAYADLAARAIEQALEAAIARCGSASLALAGGATPLPVYRRLVERAQVGDSSPWARTSVFFGDERAVPFQSPDSNFRAASEALLRWLPTPPVAVHPMPVLLAEPANAPAAYAGLLPIRLDVVLAGVGDDGHILSLFPASPLLLPSSGRVAWAEGPAAPHRRLTLTPAVVTAAHVVLVLVTGGRKADVVASVLTGAADAAALPAALCRERTWILDEPAASRLPPEVLATATRSLEVP